MVSSIQVTREEYGYYALFEGLDPVTKVCLWCSMHPELHEGGMRHVIS